LGKPGEDITARSQGKKRALKKSTIFLPQVGEGEETGSLGGSTWRSGDSRNGKKCFLSIEVLTMGGERDYAHSAALLK